jgi:hypothetical protein
MGKTFPHPLGKGMDKPESRFYTQVYSCIYGDEIVMDFAIEAIRGEKLGRGDPADILVVSLSANDAAGHTWGPDSVEAKEVLWGVDRQVAKLIAALDGEVGPGRWVMGFTADHGVSFPPDAVTARGFPAARHDTADTLKKINRRLNFTIRYLDWSLGFCGAGFYFDPDALRYGGKPAAELEDAAAEVIRESTGVAEVFTRSAILGGRLPDTDLGRRVRAAYHPSRSPDVYVVNATYSQAPRRPTGSRTRTILTSRSSSSAAGSGRARCCARSTPSTSPPPSARSSDVLLPRRAPGGPSRRCSSGRRGSSSRRFVRREDIGPLEETSCAPGPSLKGPSIRDYSQNLICYEVGKLSMTLSDDGNRLEGDGVILIYFPGQDPLDPEEEPGFTIPVPIDARRIFAE